MEKGAYGDVYKCIDKNTYIEYACKVINIKNLLESEESEDSEDSENSENILNRLDNEKQILKNLSEEGH